MPRFRRRATMRLHGRDASGRFCISCFPLTSSGPGAVRVLMHESWDLSATYSLKLAVTLHDLAKVRSQFHGLASCFSRFFHSGRRCGTQESREVEITPGVLWVDRKAATLSVNGFV